LDPLYFPNSGLMDGVPPELGSSRGSGVNYNENDDEANRKDDDVNEKYDSVNESEGLASFHQSLDEIDYHHKEDSAPTTSPSHSQNVVSNNWRATTPPSRTVPRGAHVSKNKTPTNGTTGTLAGTISTRPLEVLDGNFQYEDGGPGLELEALPKIQQDPNPHITPPPSATNKRQEVEDTAALSPGMLDPEYPSAEPTKEKRTCTSLLLRTFALAAWLVSSSASSSGASNSGPGSASMSWLGSYRRRTATTPTSPHSPGAIPAHCVIVHPPPESHGNSSRRLNPKDPYINVNVHGVGVNSNHSVAQEMTTGLTSSRPPTKCHAQPIPSTTSYESLSTPIVSAPLMVQLKSTKEISKGVEVEDTPSPSSNSPSPPATRTEATFGTLLVSEESLSELISVSTSTPTSALMCVSASAMTCGASTLGSRLSAPSAATGAGDNAATMTPASTSSLTFVHRESKRWSAVASSSSSGTKRRRRASEGTGVREEDVEFVDDDSVDDTDANVDVEVTPVIRFVGNGHTGQSIAGHVSAVWFIHFLRFFSFSFVLKRHGRKRSGRRPISR